MAAEKLGAGVDNNLRCIETRHQHSYLTTPKK
jgi:hypothetical protein